MKSFLFAYATAFVFIALYGGHKLWHVFHNGGSWGLIKATEMDLVTGKAEIDEEEEQYPALGTTKMAKVSHYVWG